MQQLLEVFRDLEKPKRTRSLSPPSHHRRRRDTDNDEETEAVLWSSTILNERFGIVIERMQTKLEHFLEALEQDARTGSKKVEDAVLLQHVELLLEHARQGTLTSVLFKETCEGLLRLSEQNIEEESAHRIRDLLLIISPPARLMECLEFDPSKTYVSEEQDELNRRLESMRSDNLHLPRYVMEKVTSHLGPRRPSLGSSVGDNSSDFILPLVRFLDYGKPTKGDFIFEKLLSSGAYGSVHLGRHRDTDELVAIKHLKKKDMLIKNCSEQVLAETKVLKFGHNPFMASLYCSFSSNQSLYLVMEYAPGGDLATMLKHVGRLSECVARRYFAEAVLAVEYIHEFGIVHRDIKPDNLVIAKGGHIKLIDFGLSKFGVIARTSVMLEGEDTGGNVVSPTGSTSEKGNVVGTPTYIAPEVILGKSFGPPVDWWSMGVILYEFITGHYPFTGETAEEIFDKAVNEPYTPVEAVVDDEEFSGEILDLIQRLLQKLPELRLGTNSIHFDNDLGAEDIKDHLFFELELETDEGETDVIDWDRLLEEKANFVPELDHELDTQYHDARSDRYEASVISDSEDETSDDESLDTEKSGGTIGSTLFRNFSCVNLPMSTSRSNSPQIPRTITDISGTRSPIDRARSLAEKKRTESEPTPHRNSNSPKSPTSPTFASTHYPVYPDCEDEIPMSPPHITAATSNNNSNPILRKERLRQNSGGSKPQVSSPLRQRNSNENFAGFAVGSPSNGATTGGLSRKTAATPDGGHSPTQSRPQQQPAARPSCPLGLGCKKCKDVVLEWTKDKGFGFSFQTELSADRKSIHRVSIIVPGSPAATAGMRVNSEIILVNGQNTKEMSRRKLEKVIAAAKQRSQTRFHCGVSGTRTCGIRIPDAKSNGIGMLNKLRGSFSGNKQRSSSRSERRQNSEKTGVMDRFSRLLFAGSNSPPGIRSPSNSEGGLDTPPISPLSSSPKKSPSLLTSFMRRSSSGKSASHSNVISADKQASTPTPPASPSPQKNKFSFFGFSGGSSPPTSSTIPAAPTNSPAGQPLSPLSISAQATPHGSRSPLAKGSPVNNTSGSRTPSTTSAVASGSNSGSSSGVQTPNVFQEHFEHLSSPPRPNINTFEDDFDSSVHQLPAASNLRRDSLFSESSESLFGFSNDEGSPANSPLNQRRTQSNKGAEGSPRKVLGSHHGRRRERYEDDDASSTRSLSTSPVDRMNNQNNFLSA